MSGNNAESCDGFLEDALRQLTYRKEQMGIGSMEDRGSSSSSPDRVLSQPTADQIPIPYKPATPHKPQAIRIDELVNQGKELPVAQTLQEVANIFPINAGTSEAPIVNYTHWNQAAPGSMNSPLVGIPPSYPPTTALIPQNGGLPSFGHEEVNLIHQNQQNNLPGIIPQDGRLLSFGHEQQVNLIHHNQQNNPSRLLDQEVNLILQNQQNNHSRLLEQEVNLIHQNQQNNPPANALQTERLLSPRPQPMGLYEILNQGRTALPVVDQQRDLPNPFANNNTDLGNNTYHLPVSNLPPEYRLDSSSRLQVSQITPMYSQNTTQLGGRNGGTSFFNPEQVNRPPGIQSIPQEPLIPFRPQQLPSDQQLDQVSLMSNMFDAQRRNNMQPGAFMPSRRQEIQFQGLANQSGGTSSMYPGLGTLNQPQFSNVQIQRGFRGNIGSTLPNQTGGSSLNHNMQGMQGNGIHATNQHEFGESLSGRSQRTWQERIPTTSNPQQLIWFSQVQANQGLNLNVTDHFNIGVPAFSVYDPRYEAFGLPVDPHLRVIATRQRRGNGGT